jgi:hypothetical protein
MYKLTPLPNAPLQYPKDHTPPTVEQRKRELKREIRACSRLR